MCNELRKVYVMALCPIMLCALQHIYITVWGSIDTHRYIYILYIIIIFISMPFYMGIDINIFIRVCARRAREASNRCKMVDSGLTQKQCPKVCVFVCVLSVTHANGTGEGSPFQGYAPGWAAPPLIFYFF